MSTRIRRWTRVALLLAIFAVPISLVPTRAAHADPTVSRVTVGVRPVQFAGACPANLTFIGTILVTHPPVVVEYVWERSDGARSASQRIEVHGKGRGVTETWDLGAAHARLSVWEKPQVLAPNFVTSTAAVAHIDCR